MSKDPEGNWRVANWQICIGYALFFAGIAAFTPYAAIYYRSLGFTGLQVGVLTSMPAIGLIVSGTFWGAVADAYAAHRTLLRISLAASTIFAFVASRFTNFWLLLTWIVLLSFTTVPLRSLMDHYAVTIGEHISRPFGRIRLWGAFGYSAFVVTLGRIMSREITSAFLVGYAIALAVALAATWRLPRLEHRTPERLIDGIRNVMGSTTFRWLLFFAFAQASVAFIVVVTLGVHIVSHGGTNTQVGTAFAVAALSELPVFLVGARVVRRFGPVRVLVGVGVLYSARMMALSVVTTPWAVIVLQSLHGVSFGAFLVTAVPFARSIAGRAYPATAQAVLTMVSFGFGVIAGSMFGAAGMDIVSTSVLYLWVAAVMGVATFVYAFTQWRSGQFTPRAACP